MLIRWTEYYTLQYTYYDTQCVCAMNEILSFHLTHQNKNNTYHFYTYTYSPQLTNTI